jgi:Mg2+ and Co2+ transporter CorA
MDRFSTESSEHDEKTKISALHTPSQKPVEEEADGGEDWIWVDGSDLDPDDISWELKRRRR